MAEEGVRALACTNVPHSHRAIAGSGTEDVLIVWPKGEAARRTGSGGVHKAAWRDAKLRTAHLITSAAWSVNCVVRVLLVMSHRMHVESPEQVRICSVDRNRQQDK